MSKRVAIRRTQKEINGAAVLDAALRQDFVAFVQKVFHEVNPNDTFEASWGVELMADRAEQCRLGMIRRLIVNVPPRSLKSIILSIALPAFILGHDPSARIICVSYAGDLAAQFSRQCRKIIKSAWYRRMFPRTRIAPDKDTEFAFETTAGGSRYATSVGGTLTGKGGQLIIVDDPQKADDVNSDAQRQSVNRWLVETLMSRLDNKKTGVIIIVQQRLHDEDVSGVQLGAGGWTHLCLPAIAETRETFRLRDGRSVGRKRGTPLYPKREPLAVLESIKRSMGTRAFEAQYQQNPLPLDGSLIHWSWFGKYKSPYEPEFGDRVFQSWDVANKESKRSDFSACLTFAQRGKYLFIVDIYRGRHVLPELKRKATELAARFRPQGILVEDAASGTALIQELRAGSPLNPIAIKPVGDKITRLDAQSVTIEAGHVLLPDAASWLEEFRKEILRFPNGGYDDQVDALSQFLNWFRKRIPEHAIFDLEPSKLSRQWPEGGLPFDIVEPRESLFDTLREEEALAEKGFFVAPASRWLRDL